MSSSLNDRLPKEGREDLTACAIRYWHAQHHEHGRLPAMAMDPDLGYLFELAKKAAILAIEVQSAAAKRAILEAETVEGIEAAASTSHRDHTEELVDAIWFALSMDHKARTGDYNSPNGKKPPMEADGTVIEMRRAA